MIITRKHDTLYSFSNSIIMMPTIMKHEKHGLSNLIRRWNRLAKSTREEKQVRCRIDFLWNP
jgi:hypothetical protein